MERRRGPLKYNVGMMDVVMMRRQWVRLVLLSGEGYDLDRMYKYPRFGHC